MLAPPHLLAQPWPVRWQRGRTPPHSNTLEPKVMGEAPPPPDPTPVNKERKGLQTERSILKRFVCDFCERRFATARALDDHARCVHEVVPEMTFAFEYDGESADFTQRSAARTEREQPPVNLQCERCSATTPMSFRSQDMLDRHAHTKVVRFAAEDVVDAAACSATPAYNVLCPDGLRPDATAPDPPVQVEDEQQAGPSRDPDPPQRTGNSQNPTNTHQQAGGTTGFPCAQYGKVLKTRKGRTYHMLEKHCMSVGRPECGGNEDEEAQRATSSPPPPPPEDRPPIDNEVCRESTGTVGAALLGET
ncbi:hypothetical protein TNCV_1429051 [Trichonephila clavipes]|nr:hypothetical protein TNCV_1429051 [Trichonephila clavipes]